MKFERTKQFEKAYKRLSTDDQGRIDKALNFLSQNPLHPSLHTEKVEGDIWSLRASDKIRCTFEWVGSIGDLKQANSITLRNVGYHQDVYGSP